jgi:UDP-N-acetylmuramoylalanine-D-glutamate ligase
MTITVARQSALKMPLCRRPDLPQGPYAVVGLRRAGSAAVEALCRLAGGGGQVIACDRNPGGVTKRIRRSLEAAGVQVHLGPQSEMLDFVPAPRTLIKSPGVGLDNPLIQLAQRSGLAVLDELELGWRVSDAPMLAVTGTNGKTTVATLARAVLAASGLRVGLAGNTTLGPPLSAVAPGLDWIVCEVSSFQLEGCPALMPEVAVFTNLTPDHLARHRTMRHYGQLKRRLFVRGDSAVRLAVIDVADDFGRVLADDVEALGGQVVRIGFDRGADYEIQGARWGLRSAVVDLRTPTGGLVLQTRLPGWHNARNVAAVAALGDFFGVDHAQLAETIAGQAGPPGRLEFLDFGQRHGLVLDCAASPAAVEQVLLAVRAAMTQGGRIHVVLGVLGSPDRAQGHAMGGRARELGDRLIVTAGSLRPHPPLQAIDGLVSGAADADGATVEVVPRRREAIRMALLAARPNDVVAVLGRGDLSEAVSGRRVDDRTVLQELVTCERC